MKKIRKILLVSTVMVALFLFGTLLSDRQTLNEELIRLHVVANSDTQADQVIKLNVRDAVLKMLEAPLEKMETVHQAKSFLEANLDEIGKAANNALAELGCTEKAVVSLKREKYDTRQYDTFSLPAGTYDSLNITIGQGEGENWWCVVYPSFCTVDTEAEFYDNAASAGFPDTLSSALSEGKGCTVRFFLLELLGKLENWFGKG